MQVAHCSNAHDVTECFTGVIDYMVVHLMLTGL